MDSKWRDTKFTDCLFDSSSLSTVVFIDCQFNRCEWKKIGMSTTEMHFEDCGISNPSKFISAAYTNLDKNVLQQKNVTPEYQKFRLEGTKAKVARLLLVNLQGKGDDDSFYDAVKAYTTQTLIAKIAHQRYQAWSNHSIKVTIQSLALRTALASELAVLSISGRINGWGGNVGRSLMCGVALVGVFWAIYFLADVAPGFVRAGVAALEITLLIGYTKYTALNTPLWSQLLFVLNMILGLWWYAIFVPTVVNRVNRVN